MSWVSRFGSSFKHKNKSTTLTVGTAGFDSFYKNVGFDKNNNIIRLPSGFEGRLDLVSLQVYGTVNKWWVIAMANNIFDPVEQMKPGMLLKIPRS